jgi:hypothetical protein
MSRLPSLFLLCPLVAAAAITGCSSEPTSPEGTAAPADSRASADTDAQQEEDAHAGASDAATMSDDCEPPENDAPYTDVTSIEADPPTMTGGTIADGKYHLTSFAVYTGPDGGKVPTGSTELQATLVISGGKGQFVDNQTGPSAWTLIASNADLVIRHTCPKKYDSRVRYTATPTTFAFSFMQNGYPLVETFTKQ